MIRIADSTEYTELELELYKWMCPDVSTEQYFMVIIAGEERACVYGYLYEAGEPSLDTAEAVLKSLELTLDELKAENLEAETPPPPLSPEERKARNAARRAAVAELLRRYLPPTGITEDLPDAEIHDQR